MTPGWVMFGFCYLIAFIFLLAVIDEIRGDLKKC